MFDFIQIARKGTQSKKGATRHQAPIAKAKPVKWWMWLLIPAVVFAFIFALFKLSQVTPESTSAPVIKKENVAPKSNTTKKAPPKTVTKDTSKAKKADEKENFEFYQILQDSKVDTSHVDAYKSTPRGKQDFLYMIQAASFRNDKDADRMRADLILSGMDTNIRKTIGKNGKPWYRVVIGPFVSRSKMNRAKDKLANKDIQAYSYKIPKEE
jgi:cell division protein FtsN